MSQESVNSFGAKDTLEVGDASYEIFRLDKVEGSQTLPYSLKVLLENLLRTEDGANITADHIRALGGWDEKADPDTEIQFTPARVIMQDFTGVPCGTGPTSPPTTSGRWAAGTRRPTPMAPAELVIDHSVQIDSAGNPKSFQINQDFEYQRNNERYQFLRWGQTAFDDFVVVPPGTGIVHQVNIERLARVTMSRGGQAYPDTCVGTDSHTTMVNGLGVLGWGVGGIEAEAAMLGQPVSMLIPRVVGFKLTGSMNAGVTATDVVLTITEILRKHGVVGKFVEFYGEGVGELPLANRATIGNMSPEFGSTCAIFPIDDVTLDYLRLTGRDDEQVALVEAYAKQQGMWLDPSAEARYSELVELDLSTVVPSIAGPKRPQDRIVLTDAKAAFRKVLPTYVKHEEGNGSSGGSFPASDAPSQTSDTESGGTQPANEGNGSSRPSHKVSVTTDKGTFDIDHGHVAIASITSCTNTSNPSVMMAAAMLAKNANERGLKAKPWVKTSTAPRSPRSRPAPTPPTRRSCYHLVGYGCATCIGNSGPLDDEISKAINDNDLSVSAVLSGNRNFEGRISPDVKMNYLASPPLVIAYALAGTMDFDFEAEALGQDTDGKDVYLKDIWPSPEDVERTIAESISRDLFVDDYKDVFVGDERWQGLETPEGKTFAWDQDSTYVRKPSYFDGMTMELTPAEDISGARVLAKLGDSVTTDHISPAGSIKADSPAGTYLAEHGVERKDFNSYGSRRGNHEVMVRGTFANIRLKNLLLDGVEGGYTRNFLDGGEQTTIYEASEAYQEAGVPLVILGGKEYGSGSSRDWAAKGTRLLGVKAVITESYERIHRSNLIGMGVLPLQFPEGESADSLGLDGTETFDITGVTELNEGKTPKTVHVTASKDGGDTVEFDAVVRIDTPGEREYYLNDGILQYVLRSLVTA